MYGISHSAAPRFPAVPGRELYDQELLPLTQPVGMRSIDFIGSRMPLSECIGLQQEVL
jgi:hypothetical protein